MKKIYVGCFDEAQLAAGADKTAVETAMSETGLQYTETEIVQKRGIIVGLKIWVCNRDTVLAKKMNL